MDVDFCAVKDFLILVELKKNDEVEIVAELGIAEVAVLFGEAERKSGLTRILEVNWHVERFLLDRAKLLETELKYLLMEVVDALEVFRTGHYAHEILVFFYEVHKDRVVCLEAVIA